jgi:hypothetical protein
MKLVGRVGERMGPFHLESRHEALHRGIVIAVASSPHTGLQAGLGQQGEVEGDGIGVRRAGPSARRNSGSPSRCNRSMAAGGLPPSVNSKTFSAGVSWANSSSTRASIAGDSFHGPALRCDPRSWTAFFCTTATGRPRPVAGFQVASTSNRTLSVALSLS